MNLWTRFRLHLRRDRLRQRFMQSELLLHTLFQEALLSQQKQEQRRWVHVEWLSEPLLYVVPDAGVIPRALVGIAASYVLDGDDESVQTQAGTALYYFQDNAWQTQGKVLLNMTPAEAMLHLEREATLPAATEKSQRPKRNR